MITREDLVRYLDDYLCVGSVADYCPNGLQVAGCPEIHHLVTGVTACRELIDRAIERRAQALLVHHGYFWKGEDPRVVGIKRERLALLLRNDISLLVYHLPLDIHPRVGNNAQLGAALGIEVRGTIDSSGSPGHGVWGRLAEPVPPRTLGANLEKTLGRAPLWIDGGNGSVQTLGWCTGAAQSFIGEAASRGLDAYLSGEISEPTVHTAREAGIHYFAAGHHATERFGPRALGEHLAATCDITVEFVDVENPV